MTPKAENLCCHCGKPFRSEMRWKIPLIIGLFILAVIISIFVELVWQ